MKTLKYEEVHRVKYRDIAEAGEREVRQSRSRPVLDAMNLWLKATMAKLSRKSDVAKAIHYALER